MLENTEGAIKNEQYRVHKTKIKNITIHKQTQMMLIRHEPSYKQLEVKTNRISFLCENCRDITTQNSESEHKDTK